MSRRKMTSWTLGAIMVLVPTSFYAGTALNSRMREGSVIPSSLFSNEVILKDNDSTDKITGRAAAAAAAAISAPSPREMSSTISDPAILQSRLKSLKLSRTHLEQELKDNKAKLERLEDRIRRRSEAST